MATTIKCPNCGNAVEITEAISHELEEKIMNETKAKHQAEVNQLRKEQEQLVKSKEAELEKAKSEITKSAREEAIEKVRKEYDSKIEMTKEEAEAREKQNRELQNQLSEMMKQLREAKNAEGNLKIQFEKKLMEEQEIIKQAAKKEAEDELNLQVKQKDKQLEDLRKQLVEAQRKAQQGSQQLQGEVQELALEDLLKKEFIYDEIKEVPKGINGADIIQCVRNNIAMECGLIVWESKNTKAWSHGWITKLKEDTRALKGDLSVLVSNVLPEGINGFGQVDGVWVCNMQSAIPLAHALRLNVISISDIKEANTGKATKAEIVYNYLISNEFKQRIEIFIEYFRSRKEEIEKEKSYFMKKWDKEDKNIMRIVQNTTGMYGDIQGLIGNAFPKVDYLEIDGDDEETEKPQLQQPSQKEAKPDYSSEKERSDELRLL